MSALPTPLKVVDAEHGRARSVWPRSIAAHLRVLTAGTLLPLLALATVFAYQLADAERRVIEAERADVTNNLALLVEGEVATLSSMLRTLALSVELHNGDFEQFRHLAAPASREPYINAIVVYDRSGQQLFSTLVAAGQPLAKRLDTTPIDDAFEGKTIVSNVVAGLVLTRPMITVSVPVMRDGKVVYALTAGIVPTRFQRLFAAAHLEPTWVSAIIDGQGRFIARSQAADTTVGNLARPELIRVARDKATVGRFDNVTLEGVPVANFYRRPAGTAWTIVVAVPKSAMALPYRQALANLVTIGAATAIATLFFSLYLAGRLAGQIRDVEAGARALAEGQPLAAIRPAITELVPIADALRWAEVANKARLRAEADRVEIERQGALHLRESESRLQLALDAAKLGLWYYDPSRRVASWDARFKQIFDITENVGDFDATLARIHPDDADRVKRAFRDALRPGAVEPYDVQYRIVGPDGSLRWVETHGRASFDGVGPGRRAVAMVGTVGDVTDRKASEEQVRLLMREVNHRAKNLLSIVLAIARQTATKNPTDFFERFSERIQALSANQDILVRNEWQGVGVAELVRGQLAPFTGSIGTRIVFDGPELRLTAAAAQGVGLALHELATNAAKYGALSNDTGSIVVAWSLADERFAISWTEKNGPRVVMPVRRGFGTTVIASLAKAMVDGEVDLDYAPQGLFWRLSCPQASAIELLGRSPVNQPMTSARGDVNA